MTSPFRLLIFDWDGTLVDSAARIIDCLRQALQAFGWPVPPDTAVRNLVGLSAHEALRVLFPHASPSECDEIVAEYRHCFLNRHHAAPVALFPNVSETLQTLHASGYWLAVATGKNRQALDLELAATGLDKLMLATRCADESLSKPHPAMVLELLDECGVTPPEAVVIGDTEYDILMAHNASVAAVAVSYGMHDKMRLLAHAPRACIDNMPELSVWLDNA